MELNLLEMSGSHAGFSLLAFQEIKDALQNSKSKSSCQVYHSYRTVGENKVILVINGDPDAVVDSINAAVDGEISVTCTPLRPYENFARHLGTEEKLCLQISPEFSSNKTLFYIHATYDHPDMSTEDFHKQWKDEADVILGMRLHGALDYRAYKVVSRREVIFFFNCESADALDDAFPQFPMPQRLGTHVNFSNKLVKPLN